MITKTMVMIAGVVLAAGTALAHEAGGGGSSVEQGLARIERAIERIEARMMQASGGMMEDCMGGGMMGGGMMGGRDRAPNEQWRPQEGKR